jgi:hypothetical protein
MENFYRTLKYQILCQSIELFCKTSLRVHQERFAILFNVQLFKPRQISTEFSNFTVNAAAAAADFCLC